VPRPAHECHHNISSHYGNRENVLEFSRAKTNDWRALTFALSAKYPREKILGEIKGIAPFA
jgi:hypothetical protein